VTVLAYEALLANTVVNKHAAARLAVALVTLAAVTTIWLHQRIRRPAEPSRVANWLMIVLAVSAVLALPNPWSADAPPWP
jgi:hypothetical protein